MVVSCVAFICDNSITSSALIGLGCLPCTSIGIGDIGCLSLYQSQKLDPASLIPTFLFSLAFE